MEEVGFSSNIPRWLDTLLKEEFCDPCVNHPELKQNRKNTFCLDCSSSFCNNCSPTHHGHRVLQIRKFNDDRVVKIDDIEKLINCLKVQSYKLNRAQVVFLKARSPDGKEKTQSQEHPHEKRGKAPKHHYHTGENICRSCRYCQRSIKEKFEYCSVTCMVKQELRTEGSTLGLIRQFMHLHLNLEATDEELLTEDLILRDPTKNGSMNNGKGLIDGLKRKRYNNEEAPPCTSFRLHKRKGVPRQSPFY